MDQTKANELALKYLWLYPNASVSGMSKGYEEVCRFMIRSGIEWLREHKEEGHKLLTGTHEEIKEVFDLLVNYLGSVEDGCTGAQVGLASNHAAFAYKNGWQAYQDQLGLRVDKQ